MSIIQSIEGLHKTKRQRKGDCALSACLSGDIGLLLPPDWNLHHQLSWPSGLQVWTGTYIIDSLGSQAFGLRSGPHPLSWVSSFQTANCGTSQPHNHRSQFLIVSLSLSMYIYNTLDFPRYSCAGPTTSLMCVRIYAPILVSKQGSLKYGHQKKRQWDGLFFKTFTSLHKFLLPLCFFSQWIKVGGS